MKRNICLTNKSHSHSFQGFDNILYTNIDNIVNHSVDILYCGILNEITNEEYTDIIPLIFNKIRLGGQLVIVVDDVKSLASMYANNSINDTEFLSKVKNIKNIVSLSKIENILGNNNQEFVMIGFQIENNQYKAIFQRERV